MQYGKYTLTACILAWAMVMAPMVYAMGDSDMAIALAWVCVVCTLVLVWRMVWAWGVRVDYMRTRTHGVPVRKEKVHLRLVTPDYSIGVFGSEGEFVAIKKDDTYFTGTYMENKEDNNS